MLKWCKKAGITLAAVMALALAVNTVMGWAGAPNVGVFSSIKCRQLILSDQPQYYGAMAGDGLDDRAAIQQCVDSNTRIRMIPGVYNSYSSVVVTSGKTIEGTRNNISGYGTWWNQGSAKPHIIVKGTYEQHNQYTKITGITFTGATALGIQTAYTDRLQVSDCSFSGTVYGLYMSVNANEQDVKPHISRCTFSGNQYGIYTGDTRWADGWLLDCVFINPVQWAVRIGYMDGGHLQRNFVGNDLSSATENGGFLLNKPIWATVSDNQFFQVNGHGLKIAGSRYSTYYGNRFVKTGLTARKAAFATVQYGGPVYNEFLVIDKNIFADVYGQGILGQNLYDSLLTHNIIKGAGYTASSKVYDGIVLQGAARNEIARNIIDGQSFTDSVVYTRYWLQLDTATTTTIAGNRWSNTVNSDAFMVNGATANLPPGSKTRTVTASETVRVDDDILLVDASSGAITITLRSAVQMVNKRLVVVKTDSGVNGVTVDPAGSETVNGAASYGLSSQWKRVVIVSNGVNWVVESSN